MLALEGTRVRVTAEKLKDPVRIDNFHIEIETSSVLTEQHRDGVENAANHCLIHNTLLHAPRMMVEITHPVPTAL
jgi:putative redox protein